MRIAVIDMGTNTFHLLIVDVKDDQWKIVYREKAAVKIGKNGINQGMITPEAELRAIDTLKTFKEIIEAEDVYKVFATATSAIRNASNGQAIVDRIYNETGIPVKVISGQEEAELIFYGVQKALDLGSETSIIMDIGGGSVEFIIGNKDNIFWKESFELGGQRLVEKFHKTDPMSPEDISALKDHLNSKLTDLFKAYDKYQPTTLVGSSGTFDTLSDIYCITQGIDRDISKTEYPLTTTAFHSILADIKIKNREERLLIPGMIPLRVDMIVVACILVEFIIEKLSLQNIRVSAYALKEGVLLNTLQNLERENTLN